MTVPPAGPATSAPPVPRPRSADQEPTPAGADAVPEPRAARSPWPEPWRSSPGDRPLTEFWDVGTASWRSRGPLPRSRPEV